MPNFVAFDSSKLKDSTPRWWVSKPLLLKYVSEKVLRTSALQHMIIYGDEASIHETIIGQFPAKLDYLSR